jgi:hypothetical protein
MLLEPTKGCLECCYDLYQVVLLPTEIIHVDNMVLPHDDSIMCELLLKYQSHWMGHLFLSCVQTQAGVLPRFDLLSQQLVFESRM